MTLLKKEKEAIRTLAKFFDNCNGQCKDCDLPQYGDHCIAAHAAILAKRIL